MAMARRQGVTHFNESRTGYKALGDAITQAKLRDAG
jgi:hypothetical protein